MKLILPIHAKSTFGNEFLQLIPGTKHARIAVPFFTNERALQLLLKEGANIELIVRLCPATRLDVLGTLLKDRRVTIKFTVGDWFHSKLYLFDLRAAIIGSSNLTKGGLNDNHELSALLSDTSSIEILNREFISLWKDNERVYDFDAEVAQRAKEILTGSRRRAQSVDEAATNALMRMVKEELERKRAEEEAKKERAAQPKPASSPFIASGEHRRMNAKLSDAVYQAAIARLKARPDLPLDLTVLWNSIQGAISQNASIAGGQLKARGIARKVGRSYVATDEFRSAVEGGDIDDFLTA